MVYLRPRHQVRCPERPSEAVSEALLEALWDGVRGLPKQSLTHCWRRCAALQASEGAKKKFRTVAKTECGQVRWPERPSEAVSGALLVALRSLTRVCRCQKPVSDGHRNSVRPRHQVRWQALRSLTGFEGAKKQFRTFIKTECGQGTRWDGLRGLPKQFLRHC